MKYTEDKYIDTGIHVKQHASNQSKDKELVVKETTGPQKRGDKI